MIAALILAHPFLALAAAAALVGGVLEMPAGERAWVAETRTVIACLAAWLGGQLATELAHAGSARAVGAVVGVVAVLVVAAVRDVRRLAASRPDPKK